MEHCAANTQCEPWREGSREIMVAVDKADRVKRVAIIPVEMNAEPLQGAQSGRQKAFATSLIDGRMENVGKRNTESPLSCCDGSGKAGGAPADDKYIKLARHYSLGCGRRLPSSMRLYQ
jgi:hypothetical protein